jgi:hypothetical protein
MGISGSPRAFAEGYLLVILLRMNELVKASGRASGSGFLG